VTPKAETPSTPAELPRHRYRLPAADEVALVDAPEPGEMRSTIEPWLSAMFQAEHLSLLVGNGLTMGASHAVGVKPVTMETVTFPPALHAQVLAAAERTAERTGRGKANLEDQLRAASDLRAGLEVLQNPEVASVDSAISKVLHALLAEVLATERALRSAYSNAPEKDVLGSFLLSFASRSSSRERLALFTTNYDRLAEDACERLGLRVLDRFVGSLEPVFRSSRLEVDLHYNPPGIRGEPRLLEGVVKLTKLHGSIDWRFQERRVRRVPLPFGADMNHPEAQEAAVGPAGVIYPMAAKDVETSAFPYSELFRDFSAAICRPNSILVTYGYGFGDSHINTAIIDMLTIPSTHLVVISHGEADGRVARFIRAAGHAAQVSYLIGPHFGDLSVLVDHYLPKPAIDRITERRSALLQARSFRFVPPHSSGGP
jgi:hypothetical protein